MSRLRCAATIASLAIVPVLAGCGGSSHSGSVTNVSVTSSSAGAGGGNVFSAAGMALHFNYPAAFHPIVLATDKTAGDTSKGTHAAVGLDGVDFIRVSRFPGLPFEVTHSNINAYRPGFDRLVSSVVGQQATSRVGSAGGRPALFWPTVPQTVAGGTVDLTLFNVFVGHDEYELTCQASAAHRTAIDAACQQMIQTLRVSR